MVVMVHAISWLPRWFIYQPLANSRMKGFKTWDAAECRKFSQTATSLLFFGSSAFFVARILLRKDWLFSRQGWHDAHTYIVEADYKFYYLLYMARFLSDLVSIFFEDRKTVRVVTLNWKEGSVHCILIPPFCFNCFAFFVYCRKLLWQPLSTI